MIWASMSLEPPKIKSVSVSPSICHEMMGPDAMILVFRMFNFKPAFLLSLPSSKRSLVPLHFLHWSGIIWVSEAVDISPGNLDSSL